MTARCSRRSSAAYTTDRHARREILTLRTTLKCFAFELAVIVDRDDPWLSFVGSMRSVRLDVNETVESVRATWNGSSFRCAHNYGSVERPYVALGGHEGRQSNDAPSEWCRDGQRSPHIPRSALHRDRSSGRAEWSLVHQDYRSAGRAARVGTRSEKNWPSAPSSDQCGTVAIAAALATRTPHAGH